MRRGNFFQIVDREVLGRADVLKSRVLNRNTKKFHKPTCSSVKQMKEKNRQVYEGTREEIIQRGYAPCKRCKP